jgi:hypothetical protein
VTAANRPDTQRSRWHAWDAKLGAPGPWHVRSDHPDGSKDVRWRLDSGAPGIGDHHFEDLVYGGELVAPAHADTLFVLTEGEKPADAVRDAGYVGIGTVCGAGSTPSDDVIRLFKGRNVVLWPDADMIGAEHMARIATRLERLGAKALWLVNWREAEDHDDAADADHETIGRLIVHARPMPLLVPLCARCGQEIAA